MVGYTARFGRLAVSIALVWIPRAGDVAQRAHDAAVRAARGQGDPKATRRP